MSTLIVGAFETMSDQTEQCSDDAAVSIADLVGALEDLSVTQNGEEQRQASLPSSLHLYRAGLVIYHLREKRTKADHERVRSIVQDLLLCLPGDYLSSVLLSELNSAFMAVLLPSEKPTDDDNSARLLGMRSMCGIYENIKVTCMKGFSRELCSSLAVAYDSLRRQLSNRDEFLCTRLLGTLSSLLLDGVLGSSESNEEDEESRIEVIMETIKELTLDQQNTYLGDTLEFQRRTDHSRTDSYLPSVLMSRLRKSPQRDYLLLMLESAACSSTSNSRTMLEVDLDMKRPSAPSKPTTAQSEIQRRIQRVRDVLPDLGEGYVETALSCFQGDVERTVAVLLEGQYDLSSLPVALQRLDRNLPARHTETTPDAYTLDDDEARRVTKQRAAEMQRLEEAEAYALNVMTAHHNEYDDDYDDQYDGMDGGDLGGGDGETYDVDLDTIRTYNRVARAAEKEEMFWKETRNVNKAQAGARQKQSEEGGEAPSRYRGRDKGKGGRLIGPDGKYLPVQKGGKKGRQQQAKQQTEARMENGEERQGDGMTKIQKRRKNDNKAKVGNHHRKERAQKKAASGM